MARIIIRMIVVCGLLFPWALRSCYPPAVPTADASLAQHVMYLARTMNVQHGATAVIRTPALAHLPLLQQSLWPTRIPYADEGTVVLVDHPSTIMPSHWAWLDWAADLENTAILWATFAITPSLQPSLPAVMGPIDRMVFDVVTSEEGSHRIRLRFDAGTEAAMIANTLDGILALGILETRFKPVLTQLLGSVTVSRAGQIVTIRGEFAEEHYAALLGLLES